MIAQPGIEHETFKALLEKHLSQINQGDALQKFRNRSWDRFLELGLPSRGNEVYRYIKLRHLFGQNFCLPEAKQVTLQAIESSIFPECQHSVLVFVNGHYTPSLSNMSGISSKVVFSSLQEAMSTYGAFLTNQWAKLVKEEKDPFAALNGALHTQGAFIYIPPKLVVETPIQVLHVIDAPNQMLMLMPRLNMFIGQQAQVSVVTSQKILASQGHFVNQTAEVLLNEESHLHYTQALIEEHPASWHFDSFRATLKKNATVKTVSLTEGSATVRYDYKIALTGENAEALLNGIMMLSDKREAHINIFMDHQAPHCRSYQLFKSVLSGFSRSSFEGKIMVHQEAQKTEAFQLNNNLILSDHAHADSKPNLEIFADDVKASHGATIGQLDADQLFYMKTRGFPEAEAKNLLVFGFCEQVIDQIRLPSLKKLISHRAQRYVTRGS